MLRRYLTPPVIAAIAFIAFMAMSPAAHAVLTLSLDDGVSSASVTDDDGDGVLRFDEALSIFDVNGAIALSQPRLAGLPTVIDLNSLNSSLTAGTLTLELTDSDFTTPTSYLDFGIGGTTNGQLSYQAFVSDTNGDPFLGTLFASGGASTDVDAGTFADIQRLIIALNGSQPYSLGIRVIIEHGDGPKVSSFDSEIRVPEPGTLGLLGGGLILTGLLLRRRRQKRRA